MQNNFLYFFLYSWRQQWRLLKKLNILHNSVEIQYQTFTLENEIKYVHELQKFSIITRSLHCLFLSLSLSFSLSLSLSLFFSLSFSLDFKKIK